MATNKELEKQVKDLTKRVEALEDSKKRYADSSNLNKGDTRHGEPELRDDKGLRMGHRDKINSMVNAIKILPPNLVNEFGRQSLTNVERLVGFKVTPEMMDEAYERV